MSSTSSPQGARFSPVIQDGKRQSMACRGAINGVALRPNMRRWSRIEEETSVFIRADEGVIVMPIGTVEERESNGWASYCPVVSSNPTDFVHPTSY